MYPPHQENNTLPGNTHQLEDRHYELPLPLKNNNVKLPNNKALAEHKTYEANGRFQPS